MSLMGYKYQVRQFNFELKPETANDEEISAPNKILFQERFKLSDLRVWNWN